MIAVRKLTFQLTPLLDLLLIVIFAQYLEVRTTAREQTDRAQTMNDRLVQELDDTLTQLDGLREKLRGFDQLQEEKQSLSGRVEQLQSQRDLIGELVASLFRVPETDFENIVKQRATFGPGSTSTDVRQLKQQLTKLAENREDAVVQHLMVFQELRKRCDLWELYIQEDGRIVFTSGTQRQVFRAEAKDAFALRLFDAYKALPQPKSLVLILVSYGDARLGVRLAVLDGLPIALERIRADDEGRSRYDFAVLGFRPDAPPE
ncbi:MAG: hypothetical protein U0872_09655 [Planctomycetaceae bacterium]